MYANSYGQPDPQAGLSNNPFVEDPTTAHARFPDLAAAGGYPNQFQQYAPQYSPSYAPYQTQHQHPPIPAQDQYAQTSYAPQYFTQPHMSLGAQPTDLGAFQPQGGYAFQQQQQYPAQMQQSYPVTYPNASYPQMIQMQGTATPSYLAEFDPMSHAQSPTRTQTQSQMGGGSNTGTGSSSAPAGVSHPRDVIRMHKSGLEAWDTYSWKQLFGACDALKEAWSARKAQAESVVRQYGGHADPAYGYNSQIEGWKQVLKDANDNFGTVAACTFQLHEMFNSYRQSGDPASKRRVRESCNAAVKGLPDWPSN